MYILALIPILVVALSVFTIKKLFFKVNHKQQYVDSEIERQFKPLKKYFAFIGFIFGIIFLIFGMVLSIRLVDLLFNSKSVEGSIIKIECSGGSNRKRQCLPTDIVYSVKFSINGVEKIMLSGSTGTRVLSPSDLFIKKNKIGDKVLVYVGKYFKEEVLKSEIVDRIAVTFLTLALAISLLIASLFGVRKDTGA